MGQGGQLQNHRTALSGLYEGRNSRKVQMAATRPYLELSPAPARKSASRIPALRPKAGQCMEDDGIPHEYTIRVQHRGSYRAPTPGYIAVSYPIYMQLHHSWPVTAHCCAFAAYIITQLHVNAPQLPWCNVTAHHWARTAYITTSLHAYVQALHSRTAGAHCCSITAYVMIRLQSHMQGLR